MSPEELKQFLETQDRELKALHSQNNRELKEQSSRLLVIEQNLASRGGGGSGGGGSMSFGPTKSVGAMVVESEGFAQLCKGARSSGTIAVKTFRPAEQKTVISGTWSSGPQFLPVVATPGQRRLFVRDLLPQSTTNSNMIEFANESAMTGGADYQTPEASAKPETSFTYTLQTQAITTLAHWLGASRQLLDDSQAFSQYIDGRLMYLLKLKEEQELLFGTNATGHLRGLCPSASVYSGGGATLIDAVGGAISALAAVDREADSCVVSVSDWWHARQMKATGSGIYLLGSPLDGLEPSLWGLKTVPTPSMPSGTFRRSICDRASLFDRMSASVLISLEHQDFL